MPLCKNLASGKLNSNISASTTSISVYVGNGSSSTVAEVWPTAPFYATIMPSNPTAGVPNSLDSEVVKVTDVTGGASGNVTMTIVRGQKGVTAKAFTAGSIVSHAIYAEEAVLIDQSELEPEPETPWVTNSMLKKGSFTFGNYSLIEQDTGFTWIDGKHIYKKTISFGVLPDTSSKYVDINTNIDFLVKIETIVYNNTSAHSVNGSYGAAGSGLMENALLTTNKTQIAITTDRDRSNLSAYITMYYTKTS